LLPQVPTVQCQVIKRLDIRTSHRQKLPLVLKFKAPAGAFIRSIELLKVIHYADETGSDARAQKGKVDSV